MTEDEYRERIDRLISESTGETVLNGSETHAAIIVERMFAKAQKSVLILSRRFDPRIYGVAETVEQAELFLGENDRSARILLETFNPDYWENHKFFKAVQGRGNLEVRVLPEEYHDAAAFNFAVMDNCGYRFEENKARPVAIAAFGDAKFTENLSSIFEALWALAPPISRSGSA